MTKLSKSEIFKTGKLVTNEEKSKSYIKHLCKISNQYIEMKIINAMVEDDIFLNIVDNQIKKSHAQKLNTKNKQLQIRIMLNGELEKLNHMTNKRRIYKKNEITLEYDEDIEESLLNKEGQHLKYICITLNEDYLNDNKFFADMFKETFSKKFFEPNINDKFNELFCREYTSGLDKLYLKNKTMETILYVIDEIHKKDNFNIKGLNEEDIKRIKDAEVIIQNSFQDKITIPFLAKKVAINQSKLKKGFKEIFNKTIHEYLKNLRLEKSIKYLKTNNYSIKEVSAMVGYTNQGSFSYAFSNKYNYRPKDIQKKSKL